MYLLLGLATAKQWQPRPSLGEFLGPKRAERVEMCTILICKTPLAPLRIQKMPRTRKFEERQLPDKSFMFNTFLAIWVSLIGVPKNNRRDKFGVRVIFECCKGPEGSQILTQNAKMQ